MNDKEAVAQSVTKAKKRAQGKGHQAIHSNTKIQQLYNTHNKPTTSPRKTIGLAKRPPAKRRKKNDAVDSLKPLLSTPKKDVAAIEDQSVNISSEFAERSETVPTDAIVVESNIRPSGNSVTLIPKIDNQNDVHVPFVLSNPTQMPQGIFPNNIIGLMSPSSSNPRPMHKEPNVQITDKSNPRFVKYFDPNSMVIRGAPNAIKHPNTAMTSNVVLKTPPIQMNKLAVQKPAPAAPPLPVRVPPKINILSQQTIKSNINFVPLSDNKIIIKPDSKLANVLKSQKFQVLPTSNSPYKSNMIIRGTNHVSPRRTSNLTTNNLVNIKMIQPMEPSPVYSKAREDTNVDRNVYVVNMQNRATTMAAAASAGHVHNMSTIEKIELETNVITEDTPVEFISTDGIDHVEVEAYEMPHMVKVDGQYTPAKLQRKFGKGIQITTTYAPHVAQNPVVYEEEQTLVAGTEWEYDDDDSVHVDNYSTVHTVQEPTEYESSIIYTEVLDDENMTEEYVTTEEYGSSNGEISLFLYTFLNV